MKVNSERIGSKKTSFERKALNGNHSGTYNSLSKKHIDYGVVLWFTINFTTIFLWRMSKHVKLL